MKSVLLVFSIAATLGLALLRQNPPAQQHCSERFHYCLTYPASLIDSAYWSPGGDSVLLLTFGGFGALRVVGTPANRKLDSHVVFEQRLRTLTKGSSDYKMLSLINGDDYYEASFLFDGHWYHQKAGFFRDCDVLYSAQVPVNRPELMMRFKEDVELIFN